MLDTIYYKSKYEVVLIYTHRSPATLYHSGGKILEFLDEFLAPLNSECTTLSEWEYRVRVGEEDTQVIDLSDVA